jgi:hypothetical protein
VDRCPLRDVDGLLRVKCRQKVHEGEEGLWTRVSRSRLRTSRGQKSLKLMGLDEKVRTEVSQK